jgi:hypothetical protein
MPNPEDSFNLINNEMNDNLTTKSKTLHYIITSIL